jgi:hypothetical protein
LGVYHDLMKEWWVYWDMFLGGCVRRVLGWLDSCVVNACVLWFGCVD